MQAWVCTCVPAANPHNQANTQAIHVLQNFAVLYSLSHITATPVPLPAVKVEADAGQHVFLLEREHEAH